MASPLRLEQPPTEHLASNPQGLLASGPRALQLRPAAELHLLRAPLRGGSLPSRQYLDLRGILGFGIRCLQNPRKSTQHGAFFLTGEDRR